MAIVLLLARLFLGAVFVMSAVPKLVSPGQFAKDVRSYGILRGPLAIAFAWILPFVELGAALLLLTGFYPTWASLVVVAMLLSFMAAAGVAMARGLSLSCSCFGLLYRERVGWSTQIRDGILLAMALCVLVADSGELTLARMVAEPGRVSHALGLTFAAVALGAGLVASTLSIRLTRRQEAQDHL